MTPLFSKKVAEQNLKKAQEAFVGAPPALTKTVSGHPAIRNLPPFDCAIQSLPTDTWRDRIRRKLFRQTPCLPPEVARPEDWKDCLVNETTITLSWVDRFKFFLTGRAVLRQKTVTQFEIGCHKVASEFSVLNWRWLDRKP